MPTAAALWEEFIQLLEWYLAGKGTIGDYVYWEVGFTTCDEAAVDPHLTGCAASLSLIGNEVAMKILGEPEFVRKAIELVMEYRHPTCFPLPPYGARTSVNAGLRRWCDGMVTDDLEKGAPISSFLAWEAELAASDAAKSDPPLAACAAELAAVGRAVQEELRPPADFTEAASERAEAYR